MSISNIYNNEATGVVSILSVLRHSKKMCYAKALLILPILAHKETVFFLKRKNTVIRSIEEFIVKKSRCFSNLNNRYYDLLTVSINSILLLKEMKLIKLENGYLEYCEDNKFDYTFNNLGKRAKNIIKASEKLSYLLEDDVEKLYLQLKVIL